MGKIGVLGSIAIDNIITTEHIPVAGERVYGKSMGRYLGGMAVNQSLEAARYVDGVEVIGKVGSDAEGRRIVSHLTSHNVGTNSLLVDKNSVTGQSYMCIVDDDYFSVVTPESNMEISVGEVEKAIEALGQGIFMASLEINVNAALAALLKARSMGLATVLIPSPAERCTEDLLCAAESLILNRREAQLLLGINTQTVEELKVEIAGLHTHFKYLVVTMGSHGAIMRDGHNVYSASALPIKAVDSIGAGDAFSGAFIAAIVLGIPPEMALAFGCIAGGLTASFIGSQTSDHTSGKVKKLYQKYYTDSSVGSD
jgi:ribokinase